MAVKIARALVGQLLEVLLDGDARQVTKYVSPELTVKATRQGRRHRADRQQIFLVTIGKPNYAERAFIKRCQAAGEPFPVKKFLMRF
jgi:hypothetical protein